MSDLFSTLQERYQALVARKEQGEAEMEFVDDVRTFIADVRQAGATVADLSERSQLRAWMRFLANVLYDATGVYPDVTLQPLVQGQLVGPQPRSEDKPTPPPSFPLLTWMLIGGAAVVIIAVGLVVIGRMSFPGPATPSPSASETPTVTSEPTAMPTPVPVSYVVEMAVGTVDTEGTLDMATDVFCLGTSEIIAEFALEGIEPEMTWHWEVQQDGRVVDAQTEAPWGQDTQHATIRASLGGSAGGEPGQYELLVYVGEQVVGARPFQVLDAAPRVSNLQVSDVPEPAGRAPSDVGESEFETGVRVIYVHYDYEGLCPGLELSYVLYYQGESIQESSETWGGIPAGQASVSFQAPGDDPFPAGNYEATVTVASEEQARAGLRIGKVVEEVPPAFGDITIAMGVQPDGKPILTAPENRFDWNTKVIYAIFDYEGMSERHRWAVVWMRDDQEVAREEGFWDVETYGAEGTRWVAHYTEAGQPLSGGDYSVTLYVDNIAQSTADFNVQFYVSRP
jgi:hypothetical protein